MTGFVGSTKSQATFLHLFARSLRAWRWSWSTATASFMQRRRRMRNQRLARAVCHHELVVLRLMHWRMRWTRRFTWRNFLRSWRRRLWTSKVHCLWARSLTPALPPSPPHRPQRSLQLHFPLKKGAPLQAVWDIPSYAGGHVSTSWQDPKLGWGLKYGSKDADNDIYCINTWRI